ncbi:MAG: hypothetical protein ABIS92_15555 [Polyangia bacterium]
MARTLPWLLAAAVSGLANAANAGTAVAWPPRPALVDSVVSRVVNDTAARMAARRGVRLTRPLVVRLVDAGQLAAARAALSEDAEPDAASTSADGRELRPRAVTVSGGADRLLRETLYGHLGWSFAAPVAPEVPDEVTGLYDLPHDRLLLGSWADLSTNRLPWMRDIAQALLARRFDPERWPQVPTVSGPPDGTGPSLNRANAVNSDCLLARRAIVYGDATAQALEELDPQGNLPSPRALAGVVEALTPKLLAVGGAAASTVSSLEIRERLFLELQGLMFIAGLRAREPWTAIDEVWRRPPASTEQLLHPEKYERGEKPDDVAARLSDADQPHARWRIIYRDTVGEWGIRVFLERAGNPYRAERAAAGWGGDRALLVRPGAADGAVDDAAERDGVSAASTFVAWITTWDDDTDAEDFAAEAALALGDLARVAVLDARPASGRLRLTDADGRLFAVERRRRTVGLLLAAPADAENFLAGLLGGATAATPATPATPGRRPARHPPPGDQARGRPR